MKTPRFEELAQRWAGKASVYFVFSEEAHPHAAANERLNGFASQVAALDRDGDGAVTLAEYGTFGPRYMFDAFDLDHDGVIQPHELLSARRIGEFKDVADATTTAERVALARHFRADVPGTIPILIDAVDNRTSKAYGELPNSAYVIAQGGNVSLKQAWASVHDVDVELARLTNSPAPPPPHAPDLSLLAADLAAARAGRQRLVVDFTSPGCAACARMDTLLTDPQVTTAFEPFHVVKRGVERDDNWRLFEDLDLAATPALVVFDGEGHVAARAQGDLDKAHVLALLAR